MQPVPEETPETTLDALSKKQQKRVGKIVSKMLDEDPVIGLEVVKIITHKLANLHRTVIDDKTKDGEDARPWVYDLARLESAGDILRDVRL